MTMSDYIIVPMQLLHVAPINLTGFYERTPYVQAKAYLHGMGHGEQVSVFDIQRGSLGHLRGCSSGGFTSWTLVDVGAFR